MNAKLGHLTLRNVPPQIMQAIDRERRQRDESLNKTAIEALGRALGVARSEPANNGLEALAGSWNKADLRAFEKKTAAFERIDAALWK